MPLEQYKKKRDFSRTPEPRASSGKSSQGRRFVVQKHDASNLHYDFRLQIGDVLASWAVPKGPSLDPSQKRLAVHVEDHPLAYADFEGVIPEAEYGGGTVMIWDQGRWIPDDDPAKGLARGKLSFTLEGSKLRGGWTLIRLKNDREKRDNWLLIKQDDEEASAGDDLLESEAASATTGRTLEQIASDEAPKANGSAKKHRRKSKPGPPSEPDRTAPVALDPADVEGARKASMPRSISPQLCTLADRAPAGDDWIHEIKLDGYRLLCQRTKSSVHLLTRTGKDWRAKFKPIVEAISALPVESAVIDGEATILDPQGHTSFQQLQNAIKARSFARLVFFAFDLLYLNGYDLARVPLLERKRLLQALIPSTSDGLLRYTDHVVGSGEAVRTNACKLGLEGIVCKKASAPYTQSRSRSWLKVKCSRRQEFVVIGWSPPSGSRKHFGSLLLGAHDADDRLVYTGRVGTGFSQATLKDIKQRLKSLERKTCPADEPPTPAERRGVHWVSPSLVAEVEFTEWTDDGRLRHPSFQGLREDKEPGSVRIERPTPVKEIKMTAPQEDSGGQRTARPPVNGRQATDDSIVAGVRLTHPERVLYPDQDVTKLDLARYYERIAEHMLPYIAGRPLSTVRCPQGRTGQCFFQKHLRDTFSEPVHAIRVEEQDGPADYISVDSVEGLVALVQFGVLEIHAWGSTQAHIEEPNLLTFDLDPGEDTSFDQVKDATSRIREELEAAGLRPYLKTTGSKGLHVVAPIQPDLPWNEVKSFCADLAKGIAAQDPKHYIAVATKAKRRGKVFVDYLRNARGATAIAPFSTRARPGAPVAVPLRWDELAGLERSDAYRIDNVLRRLSQLGADPWEGFHARSRSLASAAGGST